MWRVPYTNASGVRAGATSRCVAQSRGKPHQVVQARPGFPNPIGPVKLPPFGNGLSDRFDRKPVEFKFKFKIACATGSDRFTGRYDRFDNFFIFLIQI